MIKTHLSVSKSDNIYYIIVIPLYLAFRKYINMTFTNVFFTTL